MRPEIQPNFVRNPLHLGEEPRFVQSNWAIFPTMPTGWQTANLSFPTANLKKIMFRQKRHGSLAPEATWSWSRWGLGAAWRWEQLKLNWIKMNLDTLGTFVNKNAAQLVQDVAHPFRYLDHTTQIQRFKQIERFRSMFLGRQLRQFINRLQRHSGSGNKSSEWGSILPCAICFQRGMYCQSPVEYIEYRSLSSKRI